MLKGPETVEMPGGATRQVRLGAMWQERTGEGDGLAHFPKNCRE